MTETELREKWSEKCSGRASIKVVDFFLSQRRQELEALREEIHKQEDVSGTIPVDSVSALITSLLEK